MSNWSWACEQLINHKGVKREVWTNPQVYLENTNGLIHRTLSFFPTYSPSIEDISANDWVLYVTDERSWTEEERILAKSGYELGFQYITRENDKLWFIDGKGTKKLKVTDNSFYSIEEGEKVLLYNIMEGKLKKTSECPEDIEDCLTFLSGMREEREWSSYQIKVAKALHTLGYRWLAGDNGGWVSAFIKEPEKKKGNMEWYADDSKRVLTIGNISLEDVFGLKVVWDNAHPTRLQDIIDSEVGDGD